MTLSLLNFFIKVVKSAFCFGDSLQAITTFDALTTLRKSFFSYWLLSIKIRDSPLTTITDSGTKSSTAICESLDYFIWVISLSWLRALMNSLYVSLVIKPDEKPIFTAVSSLSPVSIQTLMPAFLKLFKASGTPSWRLSWTAVDPRTFKSCSIIFATFSILRALSGP